MAKIQFLSDRHVRFGAFGIKRVRRDFFNNLPFELNSEENE